MMKLSGELSIDLDSLFSEDDWGTTVAEIIRDELIKLIKTSLRKEFRENIAFAGAMKEIRNRMAKKIINEVTK